MLLFYHFIGNTAIYFSMHNSGKQNILSYIGWAICCIKMFLIDLFGTTRGYMGILYKKSYLTCICRYFQA